MDGVMGSVHNLDCNSIETTVISGFYFFGSGPIFTLLIFVTKDTTKQPTLRSRHPFHKPLS